MKRPEIVAKIAEALKRFAPDSTGILYGSEARGEAHPDSDIDVLILLPDSYTGQHFVEKKLAISGMLYDLSLALNVDISPLILVKKIFFERKTPFTINIMNDGIMLYPASA